MGDCVADMTEILYTYAFFAVPPQETATRLSQIKGLSEAIRVFAPEHSPIAAAIEPLEDPSELESSDETLLRSALRHDQVICQLFAQLHVLPLRFGTCFVSSDKLQAHLLAKQTAYQQTLAMIQGRAEYLLKVFLTEAPELDLPESPSGELPQPSSGTAYLLGKKRAFLRQQHRLSQIQQELDAIQNFWPQDWPRYRTDPQADEQLRLYFLLSPDHYQQALDLSQEWMDAHPQWRLEWSTALPPYHFVQSSEAASLS